MTPKSDIDTTLRERQAIVTTLAHGLWTTIRSVVTNSSSINEKNWTSSY